MIYWFYTGALLRIAGAAVLSFLLVVTLAPRTIKFLMRRKLGDRPEFDHADLNQLTRYKSNTPTMGGVLMVVALFVSLVIFADTYNMYIRMALLALVWLGGLGAVDDWIKLRYSAGKGSRDGLKAWEKMLFQVGLAVLLAIFIRSYARNVETAKRFYFPFAFDPVYLPSIMHVVITVLTMVGSSNAVNLTDGMDGLAAGCLAIVAGVFLIISRVVGVHDLAATYSMPLVGKEAAEMTIICAAIMGSCIGFLWYNSPPAQVFMGDTGSLPLGGLIGYIAVVARQELLLLIAGGVFVMEAGSVLMQIGYFKLTRRAARRSGYSRNVQGKRLFRCAPLHYHFHLGGWAEPKVVVRFWLLGIIFAALALATLKLR